MPEATVSPIRQRIRAASPLTAQKSVSFDPGAKSRQRTAGGLASQADRSPLQLYHNRAVPASSAENFSLSCLSDSLSIIGALPGVLHGVAPRRSGKELSTYSYGIKRKKVRGVTYSAETRCSFLFL